MSIPALQYDHRRYQGIGCTVSLLQPCDFIQAAWWMANGEDKSDKGGQAGRGFGRHFQMARNKLRFRIERALEAPLDLDSWLNLDVLPY